MKINDLIKQRHSTRAFLNKPVSEDDICEILDIARYAPSGANTQPWQVAVLTGQTKQKISDSLVYAFQQGIQSAPDYSYYPEIWHSPYIERRRACGLQLYQSLQIDRKDKVAQQKQWEANYRAFDAPVMLLFFMDTEMQTGSFLDLGMFLQNLMLVAQEKGLATCPQAALAEYPQQIKTILDYPADSILVCGMALGYEDTTAAVNDYRTDREPVSVFTRFFS
ncbi:MULTISPECIES: nitroreductase [unclassified Methylophaga]|jgi:nitroreductase|uniref:nitroreductase n=1 Tax=unclassified Methylophaga TaxID=2629249 RepID=UPI000C8DDDEA|nr:MULTISPECIES: nitroreductase [unclassified Methylophaga]MAK68010.1 nitroreductase [Methylophaga sp.]MAY16785.1 nitroreductase [Methylophaga sp.]MBN46787.1 nitroreductase [Methylophaga sp.]HAO23716.1 nitroreductase [Methylophaga sp.]HCD05787.1 nitroreductase [Methylophaga sp.]|tara:strand:- start:5225 stop:5890 length:666 start_codon:yes stop_codon:yes gene_type:complete